MRVHIKTKARRTMPYAEIHLRDGTHSKAFLVHRLVADAFIKDLAPGEQIDHINGVHSDNRVDAKRARIAAGSGEKMRKPGSKGAPTAKAFRQSAKTAKKRK